MKRLRQEDEERARVFMRRPEIDRRRILMWFVAGRGVERVRGKGAGPRRNEEMVRNGADLCVAFPGGKGTADMVGRAMRAGRRVVSGSGWRTSCNSRVHPVISSG
jgi:hypothetical protein